MCTAHDAHSSEVRGDEALLGIVSNLSAFLSEALLRLFCKHFFRISFSLIRVRRVRKARNCGNPQKCKNVFIYFSKIFIKVSTKYFKPSIPTALASGFINCLKIIIKRKVYFSYHERDTHRRRQEAHYIIVLFNNVTEI